MALQEDNSQSSGHSEGEELKFIFQAAIAPISIFRRVFHEKKSLWTALVMTIDRDAFLKDLRAKKSNKPSSKSSANNQPV